MVTAIVPQISSSSSAEPGVLDFAETPFRTWVCPTK